MRTVTIYPSIHLSIMEYYGKEATRRGREEKIPLYAHLMSVMSIPLAAFATTEN